MKKNKVLFKIFVLALITFWLIQNIGAQTPLDDKNWLPKNASLSDEFNGTSLNSNLWQALDCPSQIGYNWGGSTAFSNQNVTVSNGVLSLEVTGDQYCFNVPPDYIGYKTGGIWSLYESYSYGYIEIYAKLPGFIDKYGVAHGDKFWPAFWTYNQPVGSCKINHDEIDVIDQCCNHYADAKTTGSGWWDDDKNCSLARSAPNHKHTSSVPLCNTWHKFAVEWNTNRQVFYFDDEPFYETHTAIDMDPMRVVIDLQLDGPSNFYPDTPFPEYFKIDYFRYYQLRKDCRTSVTILNNNDLINYHYSVKSDITFGNGTGSITLNSNDVMYFRAVNTITINGDLTVPLGATLGLIPTNCN